MTLREHAKALAAQVLAERQKPNGKSREAVTADYFRQLGVPTAGKACEQPFRITGADIAGTVMLLAAPLIAAERRL